MNHAEREWEKPTDGTDAAVSARHRKWWRMIGNGAMALLIFLGYGLMIALVSDQASGWNRDAQPLKETIQSAILCISAACAAGEFLAQWGRLLKSYCFARAETAERIKLFDHLCSAPVRQRIIRQAYIDVLVLAVLVCLYALIGLYGLLCAIF